MDAARGRGCRGPVAYFSMEFGIHASLGVYSGGLGVLSGDHCKAASDLGVPLVGVGLLYRSRLLPADRGRGRLPAAHLPRLRLRAPARAAGARRPGGGVLTISVELPGPHRAGGGLEGPGRPRARADAGHRRAPERSRRPAHHRHPLRARPRDAPVPGDRAGRGRRARAARAQHPSRGVAHERGPRRLPRPGARARDGRAAATWASPTRSKAVARNTVFTTHTPVPAGNEAFDPPLVRRYLEPWIEAVGCDPQAALTLGSESGMFNLTALAIRLSSCVNGVSRLHGDVSSDMWRHLWPGAPEKPVGYITNGVHTPDLGRLRDARALRPLPRPRLGGAASSTSRCGARGGRDPGRRAVVGAPLAEGAADPLRARAAAPAGRASRRSPDDLRGVERLLDTRALTIGFARRFATYKRAVLVLSDLERLRRILSDPDRPGADPLRGQGAPGRPRRAGGHPAAVPAHPARLPRPHRVRRGLRHGGRPDAGAGLRRVAQHAAAAAGGQRHQRPEVADQRRHQPQHPGRLVGGGAPRRQRLGHRRGAPRRRRGGPGRGRRGRASTGCWRRRWCRRSTRRTTTACATAGSA